MSRNATTVAIAVSLACCWACSAPSRSSQAPHSRTAATSGPQPALEAPPAAATRPGLGTEFGEERRSAVVHRAFERAAAGGPFAEVALYYNDREGVREQAWFRGAQLEPIRQATPGGGISIALIGERGEVMPGARAGGRTYVIGRSGERYSIAVTNATAGRYEVVASVDGLDVVDGRPASHAKRGYILSPHSTLVIDGFRTSTETVAAFRMSSVDRSYAARMGDDRNVGVVGLAFFAERGSPWTTDELRRRESADPFPGGRYAAPPR